MIVDTAPCSGNVRELKSVVPVHILVEKTPTVLRILNSRIFFKEFRADYQDVRSDLTEQNMKRLTHMASKPKKFPTLTMYKLIPIATTGLIRYSFPRASRCHQRGRQLMK